MKINRLWLLTLLLLESSIFGMQPNRKRTIEQDDSSAKAPRCQTSHAQMQDHHIIQTFIHWHSLLREYCPPKKSANVQ